MSSNPKSDLLRSLHVPGAPLVLPNAWDVPSARAVVAAGFPVVAASSAAVAASLGFEDHQRAPAGERLAAAGGRARAYAAAGADCVSPIVLAEDAAIGEFVEAVGTPVNILALPNAPSRARLGELGVARISYGLIVHRRSLQALGEILAAVA